MGTGRTIALLAAAAGGLVLLGGAKAPSKDDEPPEDDDVPKSRKVRLWNKLESIAEIDDQQRLFLMVTAYGEGNYSPTAHNGSASERAASKKAADKQNVRELVDACGIPRSHVESGSWGTFQRLAPYWALDMVTIFGSRAGACPYADPQIVAPGNLDLQIVDAIKIARGLQQYDGWKAYPTVGNLRLGWANPGFMGYIQKHADRLDKYRGHAVKVGLDPGIIDEPIAVFPRGWAGIYGRLLQG